LGEIKNGRWFFLRGERGFEGREGFELRSNGGRGSWRVRVKKKKSGNEEWSCALTLHSHSFFVPGAGVEPAQLALLVFETSASTDSAIRAIIGF